MKKIITSWINLDNWVIDDDTLAKMLREPNPEPWVIEKFKSRTNNSKRNFLKKNQDIRIFANLADHIEVFDDYRKALVVSVCSLFPNKLDEIQYLPFRDKIIRLVIKFYPFIYSDLYANQSTSNVPTVQDIVLENDDLHTFISQNVKAFCESSTENLHLFCTKIAFFERFYNEFIDLSNLSLNDLIQFPWLLLRLPPMQLKEYLFGKTHDDLEKIITDYDSSPGREAKDKSFSESYEWNRQMKSQQQRLSIPTEVINWDYKYSFTQKTIPIAIRYFLFNLNLYLSNFFVYNPGERLGFLSKLFSYLKEFHRIREKLNYITTYYNFYSDVEFLMKHNSGNSWIVLACMKFSDFKPPQLLNVSDAIVAIFGYLADGHEFNDAHREVISMLYEKKIKYLTCQSTSYKQFVDIVHSIQKIQKIKNPSINDELFNKLLHLCLVDEANEKKELFLILSIANSILGRDRVIDIGYKLENDRKESSKSLELFNYSKLKNILNSELSSCEVNVEILTDAFTTHTRFFNQHSIKYSIDYEQIFRDYYFELFKLVSNSKFNLAKALKMLKYMNKSSRAKAFYWICEEAKNELFSNVSFRQVFFESSSDQIFILSLSDKDKVFYFEIFLDALVCNAPLISDQIKNRRDEVVCRTICIFKLFFKKNPRNWKEALAKLMTIEHENPALVYMFVTEHQVSLLEFLKNYSMHESEKGEAIKKKKDKGKEKSNEGNEGQDSVGRDEGTLDENAIEEKHLSFLRNLLAKAEGAKPTLLQAYLHLRLGEYKQAYLVYSEIRKLHSNDKAISEEYIEATFGIIDLLYTGKIALDADENIIFAEIEEFDQQDKKDHSSIFTSELSESRRRRQITGAIQAYRFIFELIDNRDDETDNNKIESHIYEIGLQLKARIIKTLNQVTTFSMCDDIPALDMPKEIFVEFQAYYSEMLSARKLTTNFMLHLINLQSHHQTKSLQTIKNGIEKLEQIVFLKERTNQDELQPKEDKMKEKLEEQAEVPTIGGDQLASMDSKLQYSDDNIGLSAIRQQRHLHYMQEKFIELKTCHDKYLSELKLFTAKDDQAFKQHFDKVNFVPFESLLENLEHFRKAHLKITHNRTDSNTIVDLSILTDNLFLHGFYGCFNELKNSISALIDNSHENYNQQYNRYLNITRRLSDLKHVAFMFLSQAEDLLKKVGNKKSSTNDLKPAHTRHEFFKPKLKFASDFKNWLRNEYHKAGESTVVRQENRLVITLHAQQLQQSSIPLEKLKSKLMAQVKNTGLDSHFHVKSNKLIINLSQEKMAIKLEQLLLENEFNARNLQPVREKGKELAG